MAYLYFIVGMSLVGVLAMMVGACYKLVTGDVKTARKEAYDGVLMFGCVIMSVVQAFVAFICWLAMVALILAIAGGILSLIF